MSGHRQPRRIARILLIITGLCLNVAATPNPCAAQSESGLSQPSPIDVLLFSGNGYPAVTSPERDVTFRVTQPYCVVYLMAYHLAQDGPLPELSLLHDDGTVLGPWATTARTRQAPAAGTHFECFPNALLKPGGYTIVNSQAETWAHNVQSGRKGFCQLAGTPIAVPGDGNASSGLSHTLPDAVTRVFGGVALQVPDSWQLSPCRLPEDTEEEPLPGAFDGTVDAPALAVTAAVHADLTDALDWFITYFDTILTDDVESVISGRSATVYEFASADKSLTGSLTLLPAVPAAEHQLAIVTWGRTESWQQQRTLADAIIASAQLAGETDTPTVATSAPQASQPAAPQSVPAAGFPAALPFGPPETSDAGAPIGGSVVTTMPAETMPVSTRGNTPELTYNSGENWYEHPAGQYRIQIPDGWTVETGRRHEMIDPDFDTLAGPEADYVLIIARRAEPAEQPEIAMRRWVVSKFETIASNTRVISTARLADAPALWFAYRTSTPRIVYRIALPCRKCWVFMNAVTPGNEPTDQLAPTIARLLERLQLTGNSLPESDRYVVPPEHQRGQQIVHVPTLTRLTNDYSVTAYERGVLVTHNVTGQQAYLGTDTTRDFTVLSVAQDFLNREGNAEVRDWFGPALSTTTLLFDAQISVQIFDGGILVNVPDNEKMWAYPHTKRNLRR